MNRSEANGGGCNAPIASADRMALQELDQAAASTFSEEKPFSIPAVFYCLKGNCLLRLRQNAASREQYEKALQADPKYAEAWNNLAYLWFIDRDLNNALATIQQADAVGISIKPDLKEAVLQAAKKQGAN
jgi:tetratricopeptide (TPR) repeat protein